MATLNYTYKCIIDDGGCSRVTQEATPTTTQKPPVAALLLAGAAAAPRPGRQWRGLPLSFLAAPPFHRCWFCRDQVSTSGLRQFSLPALDPGRSGVSPPPPSRSMASQAAAVVGGQSQAPRWHGVATGPGFCLVLPPFCRGLDLGTHRHPRLPPLQSCILPSSPGPKSFVARAQIRAPTVVPNSIPSGFGLCTSLHCRGSDPGISTRHRR